ncbi:hypothetical protein AAFF_G00312090 [Aldrovandia affinis]|uniref:Reticulon n=1 Tax=Aldrovandia affinis TaxID=143900 RepID=A0AAD7SPH7_9TELE|nr:hypothetical protein AAFF_G00312090 [Aldrovandia affinis]
MGFSGVTLPSSPFGHNSARGMTSLGTGNIVALEGFSVNHESSDTQGGEGFLLFKECHYGSPPIEAYDSSRAFREVASPDQDSPESPFEVLGDSGRGGGFGRDIVVSDRLQTQTLHSTPDLESDVPEDTVREGTGPGVPGTFMDYLRRSPELVDWGNGPAKPARMEGISEFEHRTLPSAYTWELDPPGSVVQQVAPESQSSASPTLPSATCLSQTSQMEHDPWICDREEAEIMDADSSGESDDTVIEDTSDRLNLSREFGPSISSLQSEAEDLTESERWPVPTPLSYDTETNEHTLSEEEEAECGYEFVKEPVKGVPSRSGPKTEVAQTFPVAVERGPQTAEGSPETVSDPESIEPECSVSAATDSFVGFMRECLNSRQPKEPEELGRRRANEGKLPQMAAPFSGSPSAVLLDLEQEHLTICALKELSSSQEEGDDLAQTAATQTSPEPQTSPIAPFAPTPPPPPLNESPLEAPLVREVEGADADEAAQLTAHAMAALLTHLSVRELLYWRDPRRSGVVFGVSLLVLLSLATFSVISVVSYLLLALLCVTITFRVYKSVIQAVQKSGEGHPFKALMEKDVAIPPETFRKYMDLGLSYFNQGLQQMRHLFLVEDLVDSLKLAVAMWLLTYVGAIFNGITLLILADILLFTSPLVYEKNKTQIDHYVGIVRTQVETTLAKLQEKLPGAVKRSKAE